MEAVTAAIAPGVVTGTVSADPALVAAVAEVAQTANLVVPAVVPVEGKTETVAPAKDVKPRGKSGDKKGEPCRHFLAGKCNYGEKCKFKHDVGSREASSGTPKVEPVRSQNSEEVPPELLIEAKASEMSDANSKKEDRIKLEVRLPAKQYLELAGQSPLPLVNGTKGSTHALENAHRQLLVASVLKHLDYTGGSMVVTDIQGKARATLILGDHPVSYPHICREVYDARDALWEAEGGGTHSFKQCSGRYDYTMSVDVLNHVKPETVAQWCDAAANGVHYAIYHDYNGHCPDDVTLMEAGGELRYFRDIPGHKDTTPDLFQPYWRQGAIPLADGRFLLNAEWGPQFGSQCILKFAVVDKYTVQPPLLVRGNIWTALRAKLSGGTFCFESPLTPAEAQVHIGNKYIVLQDNTVLSRKTIMGMLDCLGPAGITAATLQAAIRLFKGKFSDNADVITLERFVDGMVATRLLETKARNGHRYSSILRWFEEWWGRTSDDRVKELEVTGPIIMERAVAPAPKPIFTMKAIALAIRTLPRAVAAIPLLVALWLYLRRRRAQFRVLFPQAIETAMLSEGVKTNSGFWSFFASAVTKKKLSRTERLKLWFETRGPLIKSAVAGVIGAGSTILEGVTLYSNVKSKIRSLGSAAAAGTISFWRDVVAAPVVEEMFKEGVARLTLRINPALGDWAYVGTAANFGISESVGAMLNGVPWQYRVAPTLMHIATGFIREIPTRIALHFGWNLGCYLGSVFWRPTAGGPPEQVSFPGYEMPVDTPFPDMHEDSRIEFCYQGQKVPLNPEFLVGLTKPCKDSLYCNGIRVTRRPAVQKSSIWNMVAGLRGRALANRPGSVHGMWKLAWTHFPEQVKHRITWATFEEWNNRYPAPQREANLTTLRKILREGVEPKHIFEFFLKIELNHSVEEAGEFKYPRVVHSWRGREPTVLSGPAVWSISKGMTNLYDGKQILENSYGVPILYLVNSGIGEDGISQIQKLTEFVLRAIEFLRLFPTGVALSTSGDDNLTAFIYVGLRVITTDGRKWDLHLDEEAHDEEVAFMVDCMVRSFYPGLMNEEEEGLPSLGIETVTKVFDDAKASQFTKRFYKDEEIGVTRLFGRTPTQKHSAVAWTTCGNNGSNCSGTLLMVSEIKKMQPRVEDLPHFVEVFWKQLGMPVDVGVYADFSGADFCSMRFMPVDGKYYAVYKLGKFLLRSAWSVKSARTSQEMRAIVNQLLKFWHVPFIGPVVQAMHRLLPELSKDEQKELFLTSLRDEQYKVYYGVADVVPRPDQSTWEWLSTIYGVTRDDAEHFAAVCEAVTQLPWQLPPGAWDRLVEVDA